MGLFYDRETTAGDVVRYEREELGNELGVSTEMILALDLFPATQLVWVTREVEDAEHYVPEEGRGVL